MLSELFSLLEEYNLMLTNGDLEMIMNELQKLIDRLKKNEEEFYKEVLNSDKPNFLMTSYYSLYLRFVTTVYSKLHNVNITEDPKSKEILNDVKFFGTPLLIYIKKKEVPSYTSEISAILLHIIVTNNVNVPSKDSLGYCLFSKLHIDNS